MNKGTLFTIFLLADISHRNKHLAFELTTKVAFITSIICMTADFQNGFISRIFWCFLERLFAQNSSNVVVESISACCLELRYLKLRATPSSRSKSAAHNRKLNFWLYQKFLKIL